MVLTLPCTRHTQSSIHHDLPRSQSLSHLTKYNKNHRTRNAGIILLVVLCLVVFFIPTPQEIVDLEEEAPPTPYMIQKSYLRKGSGYVLDYARVVGEKIPVPFKKAAGDQILSNSMPHPKGHYPDFQEKMYKLTAKDWDEYEATLTAFSRKALPKQMAKWAVEMIQSKSLSRMALKSQAGVGKAIPDQVWQTGKDIPQTRNSFQDKNPRASYNFYDDTLLESWTNQHFMGSLVKKTWDGMERVVLKADFWRYLVTFLEGGFYSGECDNRIPKIACPFADFPFSSFRYRYRLSETNK
jgi:hypothetical protein